MDEKSIGENVRTIREKFGASLTETAARAGITKGTLSKIENGQISSPVSTLLAIARVLGVGLVDFFHEHRDVPEYVLTRKGKGRSTVRDGSRLGYSYEALALDYPDKLVEPFLMTIRPRDKIGVFRHAGDEFIHVLSGRGEFTLGTTKLEMETGDSVYFNPSINHSMRPLDGKAIRFLCLFIERPSVKRGK